jgi:RES domain-containing protein
MEAQQGFPFKPQPMTLVAYQVDCDNIADLNNSGVQLILGCTPDELGCAWEDMADQSREPPTWLLADRLQTNGVAGLLVRSFAPGCSENNCNLVLWQWSQTVPHSVQVIDDLSRLPKTRDSWRDIKLNQV